MDYNTWLPNAIVLAALIIAANAVNNAGYDKTIKGTINKVLDKASGKYQIRYQDSLFEAYATSADLTYRKDQMVSILIPGNNWSGMKTILGGIENQVLIKNGIPVASEKYDAIGMSGVSLSSLIGLSTYISELKTLVQDYKAVTGAGAKLNTKAYNYIKKGDSLALSMTVRTSLADSQVGGNYGVVFTLAFTDANGNLVLRDYTVSNKDVIGLPYRLQGFVPVEVLYNDVDTENFVRIKLIRAYCEGFPENTEKGDTKDIFISDISINGAAALGLEQLSGYSMNILDPEGTEFSNDLDTIKLTAQLKSKGKVVTERVKYYWGVLNGSVFQGTTGQFCGWLGAGWKCVNYYDSGLANFVELKEPDFRFTTNSSNITNNTKLKSIDIALAEARSNKIKCVAVLGGNSFSALILIIRTDVGTVKITSSDEIQKEGDKKTNRTVYYFDNGTPTLTCLYTPSQKEKEDKVELNLEYKWSVFYSGGQAISKEQQISSDMIDELQDAIKKWSGEIVKENGVVTSGYNTAAEKVEKDKRDAYIKKINEIYDNAYNKAKTNYEKYTVDKEEYIFKNIYYNFPIKSISSSARITCTVYNKIEEDGEEKLIYKGTASITLYNKRVVLGMYSLNILNGSQVFQYDTKGNSPASPQLEKPLLILPLTFTFIDNDGKLIPHNQIRKNGYIKWIIPNKQTLLSPVGMEKGESGKTDVTVLRASLPLSPEFYTVYKDADSFNFKIDDKYDSKKNLNYIWLSVKYKDIVIDAYTDFSFPKDGDPGTNGTDFVAKINTGGSERLYISNKATKVLFSDTGAKVDSLKFLLYNNSVKDLNISSINYWTSPPQTDNGSISSRKNGYLTVSPITDKGKNTLLATVSFNVPTVEKEDNLDIITTVMKKWRNDKPINIVRGQYGTGTDSLMYFALFPICTNYIRANENNISYDYRIKVKPKTGYTQVVYKEDGTSPNYDNTMPFEIVVEKGVAVSDGTFYMTEQEQYQYLYRTFGNLKPLSDSQQQWTSNNTIVVLPKDTFNGKDLYSAIICEVRTKIGNDSTFTIIGLIHIPIYMIINRYNNRALNGWDGNSVQIDESGNGLILAPQIAAGAKNEDNSFTGMLMGQISLNTPNSTIGANGDIGLMGYDKGARSIFLDAKTGNATFGKQGAAQIKITANGDGTIQSGDYPSSGYKQTSDKKIYSSKTYYTRTKSGDTYTYTAVKDPKPEKLYTYWERTGKGLKIKFSSTGTGTDLGPYIKYGSGNFSVNSEGHITAKGGGSIAGWTIEDTRLHKNNEVGIASSDLAVPSGPVTDQNQKLNIDDGDTVAFWAGGKLNTDKTALSDATFFATHKGFLYSRKGRIGGWEIGKDNLVRPSVDQLKDISIGLGRALTTVVGVGTNSNAIGFEYKDEPGGETQTETIGVGQARFWASNTFVVDKTGKVYSNSAKIGPWDVTLDYFSNDKTGMGQKIISDIKGILGDVLKPGEDNITGYLWSGSGKKTNFAVSKNGYLYSVAGKIGGWIITKDALKSEFTETDKNGTVKKGNIIIGSEGRISSNYSLTLKGKTKASKSYSWSINSKGEVAFTKGWIGNWEITNDAIQSSQKDSENNPYVSLTKDGTIIAKAGTIGGWTISPGSLSAKAITIDSSGSIYSGASAGTNCNWAITSGGDAYFKNIHGTVASGSSLSGNGMSMGGGTSGSYVDTSSARKGSGAKDDTLDEWLDHRIEDLFVDGQFEYNGYDIGMKDLWFAYYGPGPNGPLQYDTIDIPTAFDPVTGNVTSTSPVKVCVGHYMSRQHRYLLGTDDISE